MHTVGICLALVVHLAIGGSITSLTPYRLGISSCRPKVPPSTQTSLPGLGTKSKNDSHRFLNWWTDHGGDRIFRWCIFIYNTRASVASILDDSWEAVRDPDRVFQQQIHHDQERTVVKRRTMRAETLRKLVGAGYTPRLVWLFGLMLRGIIGCTDLPKVFEPHLGFGSGAVLAARFAHREWLPCIMLGWYGGGFYWNKIFGVDGPPRDGRFNGVPIKIREVRI